MEFRHRVGVSCVQGKGGGYRVLPQTLFFLEAATHLPTIVQDEGVDVRDFEDLGDGCHIQRSVCPGHTVRNVQSCCHHTQVVRLVAIRRHCQSVHLEPQSSFSSGCPYTVRLEQVALAEPAPPGPHQPVQCTAGEGCSCGTGPPGLTSLNNVPLGEAVSAKGPPEFPGNVVRAYLSIGLFPISVCLGPAIDVAAMSYEKSHPC